MLLACLAVDRKAQGRGVGAQVLVHALSEFARASESEGFEVVVAHAIDEDAMTFYARYGFQRFAAHSLHLFKPTKDLRRTLGMELASYAPCTYGSS